MTVPARGDGTPSGPPEPTDALADLRGAVDALPNDETDDPRRPFDAAEHAARFEAVHDALVAVLADVDRA